MRVFAFLLITGSFLGSCRGMPVKKNRYYSLDEFQVVEKSANSIGLGFGYDSRSDINYFFFKMPVDKAVLEAPVSFAQPETGADTGEGAAVEQDTGKKQNTQKKQNKGTDTENEDISSPVPASGEFAASVSSIDDKSFFYYYTKVYYVYEVTVYMTDWYRKHKRWRLYNQARLDYLPAAQWYMKHLDAYCSSQRGQLYQELSLQKGDIKRDAILEFQKKVTIVDEY